MNKKQLLFIVNPISGTSKKKAVVSSIHKILDKERYDYSIAYTEYAGHGAELAAQAAQKGMYGVVAVGGDGTVNEVAQSIAHTQTALGIIPCGSGNGLARHLRIPLQAEKAIRLLNHGKVYDLDYGICSGKPFFCTCGMGFDAFISDKFSQSSKRGPLSYLEHILRAGLTYQPNTYTIDSADGSIHSEAFLLTCANASQYGNDVFIAPKASMQDGKMDVILMEPFGAIESAQIMMQLLNQNIENNSHVHKYQAQKIHVTREKEGLVHCDGEPFLAGRELDIEIVPQGFKAIVKSRHFEKKRSPLLLTPQFWVDELENLQHTIWEQNKRLGNTLASSFSPTNLLKKIAGKTEDKTE